jgi:hypothetical protein
VGLMNQTPTEEKPNAYIRKIKTVQFIYIFKKVGLINQTPTQEESNAYRRQINTYKRRIKILEFFAHDKGGLRRVMIIILFYPQNIKT